MLLNNLYESHQKYLHIQMIQLMKILLLTTLLFACNTPEAKMKNNTTMNKNYEDVSDLISYDEFEQIKNFILEKGDKKTYRNFDGNNPHYKFGTFDVFLGADIGQRNINNDPNISDFNQLTIMDWKSEYTYTELIIVRDGDLKNNKKWILEGMEEGKVYLVDVRNNGISNLKNNLPKYLEKIRERIKKHK